MSIKDNPEKYLGKDVLIRRGKGTVKANLFQVGSGDFFKGVWVGTGGKPETGIIPFAEIENHFVEIEK